MKNHIEPVNDRLPNETVETLIKEHNTKQYRDRLEYFYGKNPPILNRIFKDTSAPHNKIPVSYGRKIIKTVAGYMFKPGLISYTFEDEAYGKRVRELLDENHEPNKTYALGEQASLQGLGFELHYLDEGTPRFAKVNAASMIPIYDWGIEPRMWACIRHVVQSEELEMVDVYYEDAIDHFRFEGRHVESRRLEFVGTEENLYGDVPVVVYRNNDEEVGDIDPVFKLIDAYDVLLSDSLNEFDRFAFAYLVFKGLGSMTEDDKKSLKERRGFMFPDDGDVKFLTKDIPTEFIDFMSNHIRKEIHKQTHIPDFTDDRLVSGDLSGKAIKYMLYDFEFIGATKESSFREGLERRFELMDSILMRRDGNTLGKVDIVMNRNLPGDVLDMAEAYKAFAGHISEHTLIKEFAPFVDDVEEELELIEEERENRMDLFGVANGNEESSDESEESDEADAPA